MYLPDHPCYYRNHPPMPAAAIPPADASLYNHLPVTRKAQVAELAETRAALLKALERYEDLAARGEDALMPLDRLFGNLHSSLSLAYSHITYYRGLIRALEAVLGPEQGTLF